MPACAKQFPGSGHRCAQRFPGRRHGGATATIPRDRFSDGPEDMALTFWTYNPWDKFGILTNENHRNQPLM